MCAAGNMVSAVQPLLGCTYPSNSTNILMPEMKRTKCVYWVQSNCSCQESKC